MKRKISLPAVPPGVTPEIRNWLTLLKQAMENQVPGGGVSGGGERPPSSGGGGGQGPQGPPGVTYHTWIAYANSADGTVDFTTGMPNGHYYIGIATDKLVPVESSNPADYAWTQLRGTDGVPGADGADGASTYVWFAYANSADGVTDFTTGVPGTRTYIGVAPNKTTPTESTNPADYTWSKFVGEDGIMGPPGDDGLPTYVWVAYADSADGTLNFTTQAPGTRSYIGIASNKPVPLEGTDPADYKWSKFVGEDGLPGQDGQSAYTWIAYASSPDGVSNFTTGAPGGRTYIGIANNQSTPVESTNPAAYTWSKFVGDAGIPGAPGADGLTTYTWIAYADSISGAVNFTTGAPGGRKYIGIVSGKPTAIESTNPADYYWSKFVGEDGTPGEQGIPGAPGATLYTWIAYANSADGVTDFTTGVAGGRTYIGIATNKLTPTESDNPADYSWSEFVGPPGSDAPAYNPNTDYTIPAAPSSVVGSGTASYLIWSWQGASQINVAHTEIYINTVDDLNTARFIGVSNNRVFAWKPPDASIHYAWFRFISRVGLPSVFHSLTGVPAAINAASADPTPDNLFVWTLTAAKAVIGDGEIGNLQIGNEIKSNTWPSYGWRLDKDGTFETRSATTGARTEQNGSSIRVHDENGVLRVVIGKLD